MKTISADQKKRLKGLAHDLKPVVMIGQKGLTAEVITATATALRDHELIKVKFIDFKDEKKVLTSKLVEKTESVLIAIIGNIAILYKENEDSGKLI